MNHKKFLAPLSVAMALSSVAPTFAQKTMTESNLLTKAEVSVLNGTIDDSSRLCDGDDRTQATLGGGDVTLVCRFKQPTTIGAINIIAGDDLKAVPSKVMIYVRNSDDDNWAQLGRGSSLKFDYTCTNSLVRTQTATAYRQFRLDFSGASSSSMKLAEVQMIGYNPDLNILSTADNGTYSTASGATAYDGLKGEKSVTKVNRNLGIQGDNSWEAWMQYEFDRPTAISGYTLGGKTYSLRANLPTVWQLQASNDGTEWVTLDTRARAFRAEAENYAEEYGLGQSGINYDFAATAEQVHRMVEKKFYANYGNGSFWVAFANSNGTQDRGYNYWWMAHVVEAYVDAYRRTQSRSYSQRASSIKTGMYTAYDAGRQDLWNSYYDDMEWMCIACLHASKVFTTSSATWLKEATQLFDWIWEGWDESTGGILWNNVSQRGTVNSKNSCSNGPAMIAAALLYQETGERQYLDKAVKIFDFMQKYNLFDDGFVKDSPGQNDRGWAFTYNQGTWVGGCLELYKITGDKKYYDIAIDLLDKCTGSSWYSPQGILREGDGFGDGDGGMFKGIFVRYLTEWVLSGLLDEERQVKYTSYLLENARSLYNAALIKPDMTIMANWVDRGMATSGKYCSAVVLSGLFLLEGVDRLKQEGYINEDYSVNNPFVGEEYTYYRICATENCGGGAVEFDSFALLGDQDNEDNAVGTIEAEDAADGQWFTIGGAPVEGRPTVPGIYISKGKKIIIK